MSKKKPVISNDPLTGLDGDGIGVGETGATGEAAAAATMAGDAAEAETAGGVFVLPSSLTIAEVGELYPTLAERLQQAGDLEIDCSAVDAVDGAGLQLLAALNRSASERQVSVSWKGATQVLRLAIAELGLSDLLEVA